MKLTVHQKLPGCADGNYRIEAKGYIAASLHWAVENGALEDWQSFGYVPIGPNGVGEFRFAGGRAIPCDATHVLARAVSADFSAAEEVLVPVPNPAREIPEPPRQRFLVMTDLHMSSKPWQVRKALSLAKEGCDAVLITGDITNDGTQEQLELFWQCVTEVIPHVPVFTVTGNHDYPPQPLPRIDCGICDYPALQRKLLDRAADMGIPYFLDESGAYVATLGDTEIIGLNAVSHWRQFRFPEDAQLRWLLTHLVESRAKQHIILCHAPLRQHMPYPPEDGQHYLNGDRKLQDILDLEGRSCLSLQRIMDVERTRILFLSGHTHQSMNCLPGCVDRGAREQLYINAGSIRPTALKNDEPLQPRCWTEGNVVELLLGDTRTTVTAMGIRSGQRMARGHYCFLRKDESS